MNANPPHHRPLGPVLLLSGSDEVRRLAAASLRVNRWQVQEYTDPDDLFAAIHDDTELVIVDGNDDWRRMTDLLELLPKQARVPVLLVKLEGPKQERLVSRLHGSLDSSSLPFNPTTIHQQVLSAVWRHRLHRRQPA